ncbi:MAG TPA: hypothetical protein VH278_15000 [Burkholderiaceae bacterium]|jgi:hypothetical protein|nr:hypothetical protein [Burkholderiaceae bacterium]
MSLAALWLPIVLSAVLVFLASWILHVALPWHRGDYRKLTQEDPFMDAVRPLAIEPGDYMVPLASGMADMKNPQFVDKLKKGPVMVMTVMPNGPFSMGSSLALWFVYSLVVGLFAAYVACGTLPQGAPYLKVFRITGTVAFVGYALALWQMSIWYRRSWGTTIRTTIDGLLYGLLSAGCFGWLWPAAAG